MPPKELLVRTIIWNLLHGSSYHFSNLYELFNYEYKSLNTELERIGLSASVSHKTTSGWYGVYSKTLFLAYIELMFPAVYSSIEEQEVKDL